MAANQLFEGCLFSSCQETLKQLAVRGRILIRKGSDPAQVVQQCVHRKPFLVEKGLQYIPRKGFGASIIEPTFGRNEIGHDLRAALSV